MEGAQQVQDLVEPVLVADGLELVDLTVAGGVLRVFVDRPGGIDLDTISEVTVRLSRLLDENDPLPGSYTLEVSSPGLERPLRTPEHSRRFVVSTLTVKTRPGVPGERRERGRLESADDDGIVVVASAGPAEGTPRRLAYDDLERARTVFEWGPAPKPGAPRRKGVGPSAGPRAGGRPTAPGGDGDPASARSLGGAGPQAGGRR